MPGMVVRSFLVSAVRPLSARRRGLGSFFLCQADDNAQVAHLGHHSGHQQGNGLLRVWQASSTTNGRWRGPGCCCGSHSGQTFQNGFIGDVALLQRGWGQLHRNGGTARRVTAQEGQRHGIAAVVYTAGELASRKVISSGSGTTSSQSALPAATMSSLTTALGCSGAVTQMLPLRITPAASAAEQLQ